MTQPPEQSEKIQLYCDLLIKWNAKINLIGRATESELMDRHISDCLQLVEYLPDKSLHMADLGTGAGLPGIPLAIAGYTHLTLIESDLKKCVFLREARRVLDLSFEVIDKRVEEIRDRTFDVILSRAMASLELLLDLSQPFLSFNSKCLFMKGVTYKKEVEAARDNWDFDLIVHESKTGCGGVILEVQNIRRRS
jgi:16S rRNA (guanine527-N7)-methyltransferase